MAIRSGASAARLRSDTFRIAVEVCPSGMIVTGDDGAILLLNREIERLFGYHRDELLGRSIDLLLPEQLRAAHAQHRRTFSLRPAIRHFGVGRDFRGRRKDGSEFPVEVGLNPVHAGDGALVVCAVVDISERKRLERMQDEFVSTVSHELRTPMTSISASLGLLLAGGSHGLPQPAVHLIEIAQANCQRLVGMVNDLLDLKKLSADQMPFRFRRCEARELLEEAIEANRGFADECGVAIRLEAAARPIAIDVDPDRFIQLITNLLANAVKYSPPGENVVVTLAPRGDGVNIGVRDRGPGIPAEFRDRVFEAFTQANHDGVQKVGSGLGLSIARQIAARLDGRLGFDDAPDGGTIFHLDLPDADHAATSRHEAAHEGPLTAEDRGR